MGLTCKQLRKIVELDENSDLNKYTGSGDVCEKVTEVREREEKTLSKICLKISYEIHLIDSNELLSASIFILSI